MRIYHTEDRDYRVRAVTPTHVLYDVAFTKENIFDINERSIRGVPHDQHRLPKRFLMADRESFAARVKNFNV